MKDLTKKWLDYAEENLASAGVLLDSRLFNPCLQNTQQAVEKMLKALLVEAGVQVRKTHSIGQLKEMLNNLDVTVPITEDEAELLDSIYLPSKYPLGNVLPDFKPDVSICKRCIAVAEATRDFVAKLVRESR